MTSSTPQHGPGAQQYGQPTDQPAQPWPHGPMIPPVPAQHATPAGPEPKRKRWLHWVAYPVVLLVGVGIGGAAGGDDSGTKTAKSAGSSSVAAPVQPAADQPAEEPAPAELSTSDYGVKVKTLTKECFGSAGCNVTARLVLSMTGAAAQGQAAEITVSVSGDETGPQTQTLSVDEDGQYNAEEVNLSTPRSSTKIKAKITDVEAQ